MKRNTNIKRRLIDELEAGPSNNEQICKKSKIGTDKKSGKSVSQLQISKLIKQNKQKQTKQKQLKKVNLKRLFGKSRKGDNNNAVPTEVDSQSRSIVPIIQTRGMKAKLGLNKVVTEQDFDYFEEIDKLNPDEFAAGNDHDLNGPCHDGVEICIPGSDLEDFPDVEPQQEQQQHHNNTDAEPSTSNGNPDDNTNNDTGEGIEPGEISSLSADESDVSGADFRKHHNSKASKRFPKTNKTPKQNSANRLSRLEKFSHLRNDPDFKDFLNEVIDVRMSGHQSDKRDKSQASRREQSGRKSSKNDITNVQSTKPFVQSFKSPSDTTIYSPGLRKASNEDVSLIEKISNFVESIRLDGRSEHHQSDRKEKDVDRTEPSTSRTKHGNDTSTSCMKDSSYRTPLQSPSVRQDTRHFEYSDQRMCSSERERRKPDDRNNNDDVTDQLIVQAEHFKARVEAPKGNNFGRDYSFSDMLMPYDYEKLRSKFIKPEGLAPIDKEILLLRNFDQDDEFFHITSQIEPTLRGKIERGEYIELERLLPKDRSLGGRNDDLNKQLFNLITQGTNTYLETPFPKNGKIDSIKKWDQAFRVYAAIYTHANPERASEIWQYIYVIHTAAAANPWDNVYFYDVNFRELMASKPWRSWGKTYTRGWNMAFNNATRLTHTQGSAHYSGGGQNFGAKNNSNSSTRSWKDDCCWRYNKNRCNKAGTDCRYDHRCTYCAGWNHGFHNCKKRQGRNKKQGNQPASQAQHHSSPKN